MGLVEKILHETKKFLSFLIICTATLKQSEQIYLEIVKLNYIPNRPSNGIRKHVLGAGQIAQFQIYQ